MSFLLEETTQGGYRSIQRTERREEERRELEVMCKGSRGTERAVFFSFSSFESFDRCYSCWILPTCFATAFLFPFTFPSWLPCLRCNTRSSKAHAVRLDIITHFTVNPQSRLDQLSPGCNQPWVPGESKSDHSDYSHDLQFRGIGNLWWQCST
jgi:hypothetical protein